MVTWIGSLYRKHGLTAYNPQFTDWNTHYLPLEANRKNRCRLLLYVITGDTRGITSMLEVNYLTLKLPLKIYFEGGALFIKYTQIHSVPNIYVYNFRYFSSENIGLIE